MHRDEALREAEAALRLVVESCGSAASLAPAATALAAVRSGLARLTDGDWFERLCSAVARLHEVNAEHKTGFRLQEVSTVSMLLRAIREIVEVSQAETPEHAAQELGDTFAILIHYALVRGLAPKDILRLWVEKIPQDFPGTPPLVLRETGTPP